MLLDLIMPKMQGFDVLAALKGAPETAGIPVIVLSNLGQDSDVQLARERGAHDYIIKSNIALEMLVERVRTFFATAPLTRAHSAATRRTTGITRGVDPTADRELVSGVVERITYHDQESGFAVLRVRAPGVADLATVVGRMPAIASGEAIQAGGVWVRDRTHGLQFQAAWVRTAAPTSAEGLEKYLASGLLKGIGPHFARRLVAAFGAEVFDVIETAPDRLRDVEGIGPQRALRISDGWRSQRAVRDIMVFLHGLGVGTSRAQRIYKTYGIDAIPILRDNPYRLARDVHGIGFVVADKMAAKLGIAATAMIRIRAGVGYALAKAMDEGHCGLPEGELVTQAATLLEVPTALVDEALALEIGAGAVVRDRVGERRRWSSSPRCTPPSGPSREHLTAIAAGATPWPAIDADKALAWAGAQQGIALADEQRARGGAGAALEAAGADRRARRRQDHRAEDDPADPDGQARAPAAVRADRPRRQAPRRGHRARGAHDPSPARGEPARRPLPPRRADAARRRSRRRRRGVDGRRAADARARARGAAQRRAARRRRRRSAAVGRPGPGARRPAGVAGDPGGAAHHRVPPGGREPDRRRRAPGQRRPECRRRRRRARAATSTSSTPPTPSARRSACSRWCASGSRAASASTRCATSRCCAR